MSAEPMSVLSTDAAIRELRFRTALELETFSAADWVTVEGTLCNIHIDICPLPVQPGDPAVGRFLVRAFPDIPEIDSVSQTFGVFYVHGLGIRFIAGSVTRQPLVRVFKCVGSDVTEQGLMKALAAGRAWLRKRETLELMFGDVVK